MKEGLQTASHDIGGVPHNGVKSLMKSTFISQLSMVKTDLVFCKPPQLPPVESEGVGESEAVSQRQTNRFEPATPS